MSDDEEYQIGDQDDDAIDIEAEKAALFGDDDDQDFEAEQPAVEVADAEPGGGGGDDADLFDDLEDAEEDVAVAPVASPMASPAAAAAPAKPQDRRAALAELVQRQKKGATQDGGKSSKKTKRDKGDKSRDKSASGRDKGEGRGKKRGRGKAARQEGSSASDGEGDDDFIVEEEGLEEPGPDGEAEVETERDRAFIDDQGAEPGSPGGAADDDELVGGHISEAEEAAPEDVEDEIDKLMKPKKRKKKEEEGQIMHAIESFCAKMEVAAEEDGRLQGLKQPAVNKLKMLKEVREFLAQRKVHEMFISQGGLGVLKAWLEPYEDGSLPNATVRRTVLTICEELPIDTAREDMKDRLKRSELGSRVMFLFKCKEETPGNKVLAQKLVEKWARPIFMNSDAEADKRQLRQAQALELRRQQMAARVAAETAQREEAKKRMQIKPGEAGYRIHAAMPQASKLDYVIEPQREGERPAEVRAARGAYAANNSKDTAFNKKMRDLQRKQKMTSQRALKPSVEGRGMVL